MAQININLTLRKTSLDDMAHNFVRLETLTMEAGNHGLQEVGEEIRRESQLQVPESTGALKSSFFINEVTRDDKMGVRVGYGGVNDKLNPKTGKLTSTYMIEVHENLQKVHLKGKAKYLEDPLKNLTVIMERTLADVIAHRLK